MSEKFLKLDNEKQQRILNASMKEFTQKGFQKASTDIIVLEASISKGSLFHYFKSKKTLFLFAYEHALEILINEFFEKIELTEKDLFNRLLQMSKIKLSLIYRYPNIFEFIKSVNFDLDPEIKYLLEEKNKSFIQMSYQKLMVGVDFSKFRADVDVNKVVNIINFTLEGISLKERDKYRKVKLIECSYDDILAEVEEYLEILKKGFYK